jgi:mannose-6-phosphate isomerase-like protein (cupin superfamily)
MEHVIPWDKLAGRLPGRYTLYGGQHGASVCILIGQGIPPGEGPRLHRHPYEEVFVVYAGRATFTLGATTQEVPGGSVVIVPAGTPHKFVSSGTEPLYETSVHVSPETITEWLED